MVSDLRERQILAQTLRALLDRPTQVDDESGRMAATFIGDPSGAEAAWFEKLCRLRLKRWYRPVRFDSFERQALWQRVRLEMGRPPIADPGGWNLDSPVIALARAAWWAPDEPPVRAPSPAVSAEGFPTDGPPTGLPAPFGAEAPLSPGPASPPPLAMPSPAPAPPATRADRSPRPPPAQLDFGLPLPSVPRGDSFSIEGLLGVPSAAPLRERPPAPRWIQGQARRPDAAQATGRSLASMRWNLLALHIGESAMQRHDAPVPLAGLDFSRGEVELTLQIELEGARVVALDTGRTALRPAQLNSDPAVVAHWMAGPLANLALDPIDADATSSVIELAATALSLPRSGDSTLALFAVCPLPGSGQVTGRIALIHRSRVLQTARLSVAVGADATRGNAVQIHAEAIHPRDDDLEQRRSYDVAVQVSDVGGSLHLVVQAGSQAPVPVQLDDLSEPIARLCAALGAMAREWDFAKPPLDQPVFVEGLFTLASNGAELQQHLRRQCGGDIDRWQRIHLVPVSQRFFPLEYVYDGEPPAIGKSRPCPNLFAAMRAGRCDLAVETNDEASACPHQRDRLMICPMHFWGFHRVIERNGAVRGADEGAGVARAVPVPSRQPWGRVRGAVLGATDRAFLYLDDDVARAAARAQLLADLRGLFATDDARDWDDWRGC